MLRPASEAGGAAVLPAEDHACASPSAVTGVCTGSARMRAWTTTVSKHSLGLRSAHGLDAKLPKPFEFTREVQHLREVTQ